MKVFLNAETQTLSHNFKTCTKGCSLQENFDTQVHTSFRTNSHQCSMLYNQNNFPNKSIFFIPQINSDLATPMTSDPNLKSFIHSSHNNTKALELFNKISVVGFTIDEILTELGNESEIHKGRILLFLPTDKQDISPSHPNASFKSSSLICHEKEQKKRREKFVPRKNFRKILESLSW